MLVHEYISRAAAKFPDKIALVSAGRRLTYATLKADADAFSAYLVAGGLVKGDRVAVYLDNSAEAVTAIFGTLQAAGCIVVINAATQSERLGAILENCAPKFLVTTVEKLRNVEAAQKLSANRSTLLFAGAEHDVDAGASFDLICRGRRLAPIVRIIDSDLAAIIYTSGSTGRPKGVTLLHRNIDTAVDSIVEYLEHTENDVVLDLLPLSSSYGLLQVLVTFREAGRVVLEKGFGYPYDIVKIIKDEKITGFGGTPTVYAIILTLDGLESEDLSSLRYVTNAAAAMPATFVPKLRKILPQAKIYLMHGLTECLRTTYLPPDEIETRPNSVGCGMRNVELWLQDPDGRRLPPGQIGEMIVRGSTVMAGYWNDPEGTAKALIPGRFSWETVLRTRDLFKTDEDGYYYFVARTDELIKSRGEKVSPIEVEDSIYALDAVQEVRVIGVPDPILGQAIKAEIVLKEGRTLTAHDVKIQCRQHLEDFKMPKIVEFVTQLPKTQGGKIKRSGD